MLPIVFGRRHPRGTYGVPVGSTIDPERAAPAAAEAFAASANKAGVEVSDPETKSFGGFTYSLVTLVDDDGKLTSFEARAQDWYHRVGFSRASIAASGAGVAAVEVQEEGGLAVAFLPTYDAVAFRALAEGQGAQARYLGGSTEVTAAGHRQRPVVSSSSVAWDYNDLPAEYWGDVVDTPDGGARKKRVDTPDGPRWIYTYPDPSGSYPHRRVDTPDGPRYWYDDEPATEAAQFAHDVQPFYYIVHPEGPGPHSVEDLIVPQMAQGIARGRFRRSGYRLAPSGVVGGAIVLGRVAVGAADDFHFRDATIDARAQAFVAMLDHMYPALVSMDAMSTEEVQAGRAPRRWNADLQSLLDALGEFTQSAAERYKQTSEREIEEFESFLDRKYPAAGIDLSYQRYA